MNGKKPTMRQDLIRILTLLKDDAPVEIGGIKLPYAIMRSDAHYWTENDTSSITSLIEAKMITGNVVSTDAHTQLPASYQGLRITLEGHQFLEKLEEEERKSRVCYKVIEVLKVVFWIIVGAMITVIIEWAASYYGLTTTK